MLIIKLKLVKQNLMQHGNNNLVDFKIKEGRNFDGEVSTFFVIIGCIIFPVDEYL